jgi:transaldolase
MRKLRKLAEFGQSFWLDDLSRDLVRSGDLASRTSEQGLRGITSNPAIFAAAIGGSSAYDAQLRELAAAGQSTPQIYEALTTTDIREACDVLRPVYDASDGVDGYVSLEVSPLLARDTAASLAEARHLAGRVDRPNLMIKIPGTVEGLPAVAELLADGINVNITLLFSVERYQAVAEPGCAAWNDATPRASPCGPSPRWRASSSAASTRWWTSSSTTACAPTAAQR